MEAQGALLWRLIGRLVGGGLAADLVVGGIKRQRYIIQYQSLDSVL